MNDMLSIISAFDTPTKVDISFPNGDVALIKFTVKASFSVKTYLLAAAKPQYPDVKEGEYTKENARHIWKILMTLGYKRVNFSL